MKRTAQQINAVLLTKERFLVIPHQDPDGDAIGSVSAIAEYLQQLDKQVDLFCATTVPEQFLFLPHVRLITSNTDVWNNDYDAIIVCDSGDLSHAGIAEYINQKQAVVINIDHHASNTSYGKHNLLITNASSTTEVLYMFFMYNECTINQHMATALLTGLITDTGNFSNAGTSQHALTIASKLIAKGAHLHHIRKYLLHDKTIPALKVWGTILTRLTYNRQHDIIYTYISHKDLTHSNILPTEIEGVANFLNYLNEGRASFVIKELQNNIYKISARTTRDNIDVAKIAKHFGGGGHIKAAGFSIKAQSVEETITHLLEGLKKIK